MLMTAISDILTPAHSVCHAQGGSKKAVFELVAEILGREREEFHASDLVAGMLAREKLGSTALGDGIAIPHCRLEDCEEACGVLLTLASGVDFDAPDHEAVDLVFALVVPSEATQEHLNLLADLARLFSQAEFRDALRDCRTSEALYNTTINWSTQAR
jgi:PTS system nitrogen regulatory IIA component